VDDQSMTVAPATGARVTPYFPATLGRIAEAVRTGTPVLYVDLEARQLPSAGTAATVEQAAAEAVIAGIAAGAR
jgi:hypothetical protein